MKMKKGLMSVVFLLATSSAMAAMSFSGAAVTGDASFTVKNTNDSLLALVANEKHNAAGYNSGTGELEIDLDKGLNDGQFGVQKDSIYTWDKLFTVKNNSENSISVKLVSAKDPDGKAVLKASNDPAFAKHVQRNKPETLAVYNGEISNFVDFKLAPGGTKDINLALLNYQNTFGEKDMDIIVVAEEIVK